MSKKLKLKFVNDGKAFDIPDWTTEKHESALAKLIKETKDLTDDERDKKFKFYVVHESLLEIDPNCKFEDVVKMHPIDIIELFTVLYNAGRTGIWEANFQKGTSKKSPKK